MTRETIESKGRRFLVEGRLVVTHVLGNHVTAVCHGDSGGYDLGHDPRRPGGWWCACPARGECAHLVALQLVTVRRRAPVPGAGSADTRGQLNAAA